MPAPSCSLDLSVGYWIFDCFFLVQNLASRQWLVVALIQIAIGIGIAIAIDPQTDRQAIDVQSPMPKGN